MRDRLLDVLERYRGGLERFARQHVKPGHFLSAVLSDRLTAALALMDDDVTLADLRALCSFIYNEMMPGTCHGSPALVDAWIALAARCGENCCSQHLGMGDRWYESQPAKSDAAIIAEQVPIAEAAGRALAEGRDPIQAMKSVKP